MSALRERAAPFAAGLALAALAFGAVAVATDGGDDSPGRRAAPTPAASGQAVFARMGCGSCHRLAAAGSTGPTGPDLDVALASHTRESLRAQILSPAPGSVMPGDFGERMSEAELDALVAFLLSAQQ